MAKQSKTSEVEPQDITGTPTGEAIFQFASPWYNLEAILESKHVKFELKEDVPIAKIDRRKSVVNHARFGQALDEKRVQQMINRARISGLIIHPLVYWVPEDNNGQGVLNDGNHRLSALEKSGYKTFTGYELKGVGEATADMVTRLVNSLEGQGQSPDETLKHAVIYARANPTESVGQVAATFGVSVPALGKKLRVEKMRERMGDKDDPLYVAGHNKVADTNLDMLLGINNDVVIHTIVSGLVKNPKFDLEAFKLLVQAVKSAPKTEAAQLAVANEQLGRLAAIVESRRGAKGSGIRRIPTSAERLVTEMGRYLQALTTRLPETSDPWDVFRTEDERAVVIKRMRDISNYHTAVLRKLNRKG